ncbi:hypothetical protein AQUCO_00200665v1 [Aquilegia coerulea]|uniref:SET domain-containing protein n=1 Tax=Aquilegia coerulea TaxID=218851 RepID=A0A2G5F4I4_AQUCA|nr:hypothetical protein AQUCO_00200665v1 [Aquilegia coerulea]
MNEELMQQLRSKATELLLREEYKESIQVYSQFISLCQQQHLSNADEHELAKLRKSLCLAFSNRAEARSRLKDFYEAIVDCDQALEIENTHFKTLLCKAFSDIQNNGNSESLHGYLEICKKLEYQSRTGVFDLSDWVLNGFRGKLPEMAEYIGSIQINKSEYSGRGLFATKNMEAGTLLLVTKAIATGRGIMPELDEDSSQSARLVMWKDFVDKVVDATNKCSKTQRLISTLSSGEDEESMEVPDINLFRPEAEEDFYMKANPEMCKIMNILDVNSLTEDAISAKVLGKNSDYYGVGLWILASFINHSCLPNARRLHIGDHVLVYTSRDVRAGEEITFAYFDVLTPLKKRREMCKTWGFHCNCKRCRFEEVFGCREELKEIGLTLEFGLDNGNMVFRLEDGMRKWMLKGKEKSYLRASFWTVYSEAFKSDKVMRKWGRRIPTTEVIADSIIEAVGGDERLMKAAVEALRKNGAGGMMETEKAMKLARGVYGKVMKKQAMRALLELCVQDQNH